MSAGQNTRSRIDEFKKTDGIGDAEVSVCHRLGEHARYVGPDEGSVRWPLSREPAMPTATPIDKPRCKATTNRARKRRPSRARNIILFLAANSTDTVRLALDQECADIETELSATRYRDDFELRSKWAATVDEMARHLIELEPTIIHFSGHAVRSEPVGTYATYRDIAVPGSGRGSGAVYLHGAPGASQLVEARALAMLIKSTAPSARVVVLNACYSEAQADALLTVVDCVVGMTGAIRDDAARSFAVGFYRALGNRRSVGNAVDHASATLAAKQPPNERLPRCRTRNGINAYQLVLDTSA